ncbi:ORF2 [Anelloviridae sp.]|nr:ORF2 [Anelloviridae sp.]
MSADEDFIYREDSWLCMIRQTHELFCNCTNWTDHLRKLLDFQHPGWRGDSQEREPGDGEPGGDQPGEPTDGELLAALEDLENGEGDGDILRSESSLKSSLVSLADALSGALCVHSWWDSLIRLGTLNRQNTGN